MVEKKIDHSILKFLADKYNVNADRLIAIAEKRLDEKQQKIMSVKDSEELYRRAEYDAIISGMGWG